MGDAVLFLLVVIGSVFFVEVVGRVLARRMAQEPAQERPRPRTKPSHCSDCGYLMFDGKLKCDWCAFLAARPLCRWCQSAVVGPNMERHERFCYSNPDNEGPIETREYLIAKPGLVGSIGTRIKD